MAQPKIRGDTSSGIPPAPVTENEPTSDIIFILDKMELLLQAVSRIEQDGKYRAVQADRQNRSSFLQVDKHSNLFENFLKNFWRQVKDPTRWGIFSVRDKDLDKPENRQALEDLAAGKRTQAVEEFLKTHEIRPRKEHQEQSSGKNTTQNQMAKQEEQPRMAPERPAPAAEEQPKYRYHESMIDWEQLKNFGLSREFLSEKGLLDQMLRGYKTNQVVPITMNFGSAVLRTDARLSFQQSIGGPVVLAIHGIRQKPELDRPYFGHIFSEEDKKNLLETGNMGRVVELKTRSGEYIPSFISLDKLTNEVVSMRVDSAFIPDEIKGIHLTDEEKQDLRDGKAIFVEGMKAKSGNNFDAHIQISADRRGIEYLFDNDRLFNRQTLGGVELTERQVADLNAGKAIFVEDMTRQDGEKFSSFVKLDEATNRLSYTRYNPDSPEDAREIYVPKEIGGVPLTPEDRQQLREGKPVFIENMVSRKGEEYSSFVKLDLRTGRPSFSRTLDGFEERPDFKIPAEVWGVTLSATQRAQLQDGKSVLVEGMTGFDGKQFSRYVKANFNAGKLDYYSEDPDRKREASQRNATTRHQGPKESAKQEQAGKKSRGKGIQ
ncbi:DUF3945 domain-containing protein [uncultured Alistipes sp.]|uniref:DUF3945 domain-containing protein n=1 Tax=uncultured Alistipes sp. TaxID=538949 RepID=UPI00272B2A79|nr:DUF3945 domain-containing protein [uncultured Alistipes sp.]